MKFHPLSIHGAWRVELERRDDPRGFFARAWCAREFRAHGVQMDVVQANLSGNLTRGTLRGMHYQNLPFAEVKLVRALRGSVFDVVLDLRAGSPTFGAWEGVELSAQTGSLVVVPEGCAHGYQTLTDEAEVFYMVSRPYSPEHEAGVRWNDPRFAIQWPLEDPTLSPRDAVLPDYSGSGLPGYFPSESARPPGSPSDLPRKP